MSDPYKVEPDEEGCAHCGRGKTWVVVGPDGVALGESWGLDADGEEPCEPQELADLLNRAHALALESLSGGREP